MLDRKKVFKDFFIYSAGNYISQGLGMVSGFLLRVFLDPYLMGVWQGLSIITTYTSYTNFGVSRSACREISYFIGKNNNEKAELLKNIGFTFSLITVIPVGIGCIIFAFIRKAHINPYLFWGFIAIGVLVILERIESFIVGILRSKRKFYAEAVGKCVNTIVNIGLIFLLVKNFKVFGLYALDVSVYVVSIIILILLSREYFRFLLKKEELTHLIKIGIPLVLLGIMSTNVANADRIVILKMLGAEKLGLYSIAIMMGNFIYTINNMASIVLYPRFQEAYGKNNNKYEVHDMMLKIIKFLSIPFIVLVAGGITILPFIIKIFIPKYIGGIAAMKFFLIGMYFFSLSVFCSNFLVTINKQMYCLLVCIATVLVNLILSYTAVKLGWGIEGVALAASISYLFHFIILFALTTITVKDRADKAYNA